jgi:hypothetical protein
LLAAIATNSLQAVVERQFDFGEARLAYEYQRSGDRVGKVLIRHA